MKKILLGFLALFISIFVSEGQIPNYSLNADSFAIDFKRKMDSLAIHKDSSVFKTSLNKNLSLEPYYKVVNSNYSAITLIRSNPYAKRKRFVFSCSPLAYEYNLNNPHSNSFIIQLNFFTNKENNFSLGGTFALSDRMTIDDSETRSLSGDFPRKTIFGGWTRFFYCKIDSNAVYQFYKKQGGYFDTRGTYHSFPRELIGETSGIKGRRFGFHIGVEYLEEQFTFHDGEKVKNLLTGQIENIDYVGSHSNMYGYIFKLGLLKSWDEDVFINHKKHGYLGRTLTTRLGVNILTSTKFFVENYTGEEVVYREGVVYRVEFNYSSVNVFNPLGIEINYSILHMNTKWFGSGIEFATGLYPGYHNRNWRNFFGRARLFVNFSRTNNK